MCKFHPFRSQKSHSVSLIPPAQTRRNLFKSMREKISTYIGHLLCLQPSRLRRHCGQGSGETVLHGTAILDGQWVSSCRVNLEESKPSCMSDHMTIRKSNENGIDVEHHADQANGSFSHVVINMIGMLIGK